MCVAVYPLLQVLGKVGFGLSGEIADFKSLPSQIGSAQNCRSDYFLVEKRTLLLFCFRKSRVCPYWFHVYGTK